MARGYLRQRLRELVEEEVVAHATLGVRVGASMGVVKKARRAAAARL